MSAAITHSDRIAASRITPGNGSSRFSQRIERCSKLRATTGSAKTSAATGPFTRIPTPSPTQNSIASSGLRFPSGASHSRAKAPSARTIAARSVVSLRASRASPTSTQFAAISTPASSAARGRPKDSAIHQVSSPTAIAPTSEGSRYTQIGAAAPSPLSQTDPACSQYIPIGSPCPARPGRECRDSPRSRPSA